MLAHHKEDEIIILDHICLFERCDNWRLVHLGIDFIMELVWLGLFCRISSMKLGICRIWPPFHDSYPQIIIIIIIVLFH